MPSVLPDGSVFCHAVARAPPAARLWLLFLKACIAPFGEREAGGGGRAFAVGSKNIRHPSRCIQFPSALAYFTGLVLCTVVLSVVPE